MDGQGALAAQIEEPRPDLAGLGGLCGSSAGCWGSLRPSWPGVSGGPRNASRAWSTAGMASPRSFTLSAWQMRWRCPGRRYSTRWASLLGGQASRPRPSSSGSPLSQPIVEATVLMPDAVETDRSELVTELDVPRVLLSRSWAVSGESLSARAATSCDRLQLNSTRIAQGMRLLSSTAAWRG